jgi:hypothetical protein
MTRPSLRSVLWWTGALALIFAVATGIWAARRQRTTESYRVYDAVLGAMSGGKIQLHQNMAGPIAIVDHTYGDRLGDVTATRDNILKRFPRINPETVDGYFRVRDQARRLDRRFTTAVPYELVTREVDFKTAEKFPGGVVTLSAVGFSRSGREALVFVAHSCGPLCATGHFVFLRLHADGWKIDRASLMVIS